MSGPTSQEPLSPVPPPQPAPPVAGVVPAAAAAAAVSAAHTLTHGISNLQLASGSAGSHNDTSSSTSPPPAASSSTAGSTSADGPAHSPTAGAADSATAPAHPHPCDESAKAASNARPPLASSGAAGARQHSPTAPASGISAAAGAGQRSPPPIGAQPPSAAARPPVTTAGRGMPGGPMGMRAPMGMGGPRGGAAGGGPMPTRLPPSLQAKMDKLAAQRSGTPSPSTNNSMGPAPSATSMGALLRQQAFKSSQPDAAAAPGPNAGPLGLAARRQQAGRLNLGAPPPPNNHLHGGPAGGLAAARRGGLAGRRGPPGGLSLAQMGGGTAQAEDTPPANKFSDFNTIMDPSGSLKFSKAVLHSGGVDFGDGQSFKINMDEMEVLGELGKGNYGSVQKVLHRPTGVTMAMKEIRLELDESKLNGIIMELDILHRAASPWIVEFYGAFTIESCVYYCMEFMDAGSLDKLTGNGRSSDPQILDNTARSGADPPPDGRDADGELLVPEAVLRKITLAIVEGLRFLKDHLQIMHRDVKPTNVLINTKGEVKLCDFGVSGQLEKSLAKTNIGCQSYMAPERIKGESQNQVSTYTVSSDVWSVGLSIIELAKGCYPYPPETFANVFAQLTAIVNGPAPALPPGYSADANDFVAKW